MVLVMREDDKKIMSVSMKKVWVYESQYLNHLEEPVHKKEIKDKLTICRNRFTPSPENIKALQSSTQKESNEGDDAAGRGQPPGPSAT